MDSWQLSAYAIVTFGAALLSSGLCILIWRRREARGARLLLVLVGAAAIWSYIYAAEVAAIPEALNFLLNRLKYTAIVFTPVAWLAFAVNYAGLRDRLDLRRYWLLYLFPLVTLSLVWTNAWHGLFWAEIAMFEPGRFPSLIFVYGPWFWVHTGFSYLCFLIGAVLIGRVSRNHEGVVRSQSTLMLIGATAPFVSNAISLSGLSPAPEFDLTPLAFTVTSGCFAWGLFRLRLLDALPQLGADMRVADSAAVGAALTGLRGRILELLLTGALALGLPVFVLGFVEEIDTHARLGWASLALSISWAVILALKALPRVPYEVRAGGLLLSLFSLGVREAVFSGLEADAGIIFFVCVVFALVLFDLPAALATLGASLLAFVLAGRSLLVGTGIATPAFSPESSLSAAMMSLLVAVVLTGLLLGSQAFISRELRQLIRQARDLTRSLETERLNLEGRVAERTRLLEASNAASRQIAAISDPERLTQEVVDIICGAFDYYFVQIYLLDPHGEELRLVGASGSAGAELLGQNHRLGRHQGLVGQAVLTRATVATGDVSQRADWLPNPLLKATRSESAVPIVHGDVVLGVLDVQQDRMDGISQEESLLLAAIADQIAAALFGAHSLADVERQTLRQLEIQRVIQQIERSTTVEEALRIATGEVGRVLGGANVHVQLAPRREALS